MFGLGETESLVIVLAILLLFGAKRIPDVAKSFGAGIREFRRAMREVQDEVHAAASAEPASPPIAPRIAPTAPPVLASPEQSVPTEKPGVAPTTEVQA